MNIFEALSRKSYAFRYVFIKIKRKPAITVSQYVNLKSLKRTRYMGFALFIYD